MSIDDPNYRIVVSVLKAHDTPMSLDEIHASALRNGYQGERQHCLENLRRWNKCPDSVIREFDRGCWEIFDVHAA